MNTTNTKKPNDLEALETAYYAALMTDPWELKRATRNLWKKLSAMYDAMNDGF